MNLYFHQQSLLNANPPRHLIAWQVGTGKTRMALELAKKNGVVPLIIVPKMLVKKWTREAKELGVACHIMTKEEFRRDHKTAFATKAVIVDEAHQAFGNFKSQSHKALIWYFKQHSVKYVWLLTGTPYTSSPWSIYSLARLVGVRLDYFDFRRRFFNERYFGRRLVFEVKPGIEEEIAELVRSFGSIVRLDECIDLPDQIVQEETFSCTEEQRKSNKKVLAEESNPLARFTKYHQIASGILLGNEFEDTEQMPCEKNDRIVELAEENAKMAVFCRYNGHIDSLVYMLNAKGIRTLVIRGDTEDRDAVVALAEKLDRVVVLINAACSVGFELPSIGVIVFASLSYSYVDFAQAQGRFLRINKPKKNLYIILTTEGSADEPVLEAIKMKQNFSETIFAQTGMKRLDAGV